MRKRGDSNFHHSLWRFRYVCFNALRNQPSPCDRLAAERGDAAEKMCFILHNTHTDTTVVCMLRVRSYSLGGPGQGPQPLARVTGPAAGARPWSGGRQRGRSTVVGQDKGEQDEHPRVRHRRAESADSRRRTRHWQGHRPGLCRGWGRCGGQRPDPYRSQQGSRGEIRALGRNALALTGDATKTADMDRVTQQVLEGFGHLDTLVTCVGDSIRKPVVQLPGTATAGMTEDEWRFIVDINLTEAFQGCRALGPHLLARRQGAVVNISGWASFRGRAGSAAYDAAKAGVMRFTESLAQEWAPFGVRVNAVALGSFPDPEQMSAEAYQQRNTTAAKTVPLGRVGRLKEVGYLAVFLASPAAAYVTGQTWAVDGGVSIQSA